MQTVILGRAYEGRPMMNSRASFIAKLEQSGKVEEARQAYDAHAMIERWNGRELDLQEDMTSLPQEGGFTSTAVPYTRVCFDRDPKTGNARVAA